MLSPTFNSTTHERFLGIGLPLGAGFMFGPRIIRTSSESFAGGMIILSSIRIEAGSETVIGFPSSLGSVITPAMAVAAAVSGLVR